MSDKSKRKNKLIFLSRIKHELIKFALVISELSKYAHNMFNVVFSFFNELI